VASGPRSVAGFDFDMLIIAGRVSIDIPKIA
jgi:hypothetical protein